MTRREWLMAGLLLLLALLSLLVPRCADAETSWPQDRAFIFYNSGLSTELLDSLAATFTFAIGSGSGDGSDIDSLLARGDKFEWWAQYNSSTDNYIPSTEHTFLSNADTLAYYGVDSAEVFYLHFIEDTNLIIDKVADFIPGWNPEGAIDPATGEPYVATAASIEESRVKVFNVATGRYAVNFADANARRMMIAFNVHDLLRTTPNGVEPRGLFLDNAGMINGPNGINSITSGGAVREAPNYADANSPQFKDWWHETGSSYFQELYAFVEAHTDDIFGGVRRYTMPNVANTYAWDRNKWEAMFVSTPRFAHMPLLEFMYSVWTTWGSNQPKSIHDKQKAAIQAGVGIFESGFAKSDRYPGTRAEELESIIAGYLVHRPYIGAVTDPLQKTWFLGVNNWNPGDNDNDGQPNFSTNFEPLFNIDLGIPLGDPYEIATGVWARRYELGMAVVRHGVDYDYDVVLDPITFQLPTTYADWIPLDKDMTQGTAVTTWTLGEGMGKVFLNGSAAATGFYGYVELTAGTVDGTITDVVVPARIPVSMFEQARADLKDVRVKTAGDVDIDFAFDEGIVADSVTIWFNAPSISTGTKFRLYCGDETLDPQDFPEPELVWSDYELVIHADTPPPPFQVWSSYPYSDDASTTISTTAEDMRFEDKYGSPFEWGPQHHVSGMFGRAYNVYTERATFMENFQVDSDWHFSIWANLSEYKTASVLSGQPHFWYFAICAQSGGGSYFPDIRIRPNNDEPYGEISYRWPSDTACFAVPGEWAKYDLVFEDIGGSPTEYVFTLYRNGEECTGASILGDGSTISELTLDMNLRGRYQSGVGDPMPMGVGSWGYGATTNGAADHFNGDYDEARIKPTTSSAAEIAVQYAAERRPFDYWSPVFVPLDATAVVPAITRVDGYRNVEGEQVTLIGTNFGTAGGSVLLGDSGTYADAAPLVTQSIQSWSDTEIVLNYTTGSYGIATTVYLFVIHSNGEVSNGIFVPRRPGSKLPPDIEGE